MYQLNLKRLVCSYQKIWQFESSMVSDLGVHDGKKLVQNPSICFTIEKQSDVKY